MKLSSFAVVLVSSLTSLLVACSGEEPTPEDTASLKSAICSGGGGGGGDACTDASGFCPPECSYCFQSATQRIQLQNLWTCQDTPGGGGGGDGGDTSNRTCFQGVGTSWSNDGQEGAAQEARDAAWLSCVGGRGYRCEAGGGTTCTPGSVVGWTCTATFCRR